MEEVMTMLTTLYRGKEGLSVTGVTVNEGYFGDTPTRVRSMGIINPEL
jgi:hypothetical protein